MVHYFRAAAQGSGRDPDDPTDWVDLHEEVQAIADAEEASWVAANPEAARESWLANNPEASEEMKSAVREGKVVPKGGAVSIMIVRPETVRACLAPVSGITIHTTITGTGRRTRHHLLPIEVCFYPVGGAGGESNLLPRTPYCGPRQSLESKDVVIHFVPLAL